MVQIPTNILSALAKVGSGLDTLRSIYPLSLYYEFENERRHYTVKVETVGYDKGETGVCFSIMEDGECIMRIDDVTYMGWGDMESDETEFHVESRTSVLIQIVREESE